MVDETQPNEPIETFTTEAADAAPAPEPIEETQVETAIEERKAPPIVGEPTPSSLDNISDAELFGAHLTDGTNYSGTFRTLAEGDVVKGEIVRIDREGILVDVGQKSEGLIKPQEMGRENADEGPLAVGDTVDVMVMEGETPEGQILLSKKRADFEKAWDHVIEAQHKDEIIQAMVTDRVKGGLVVDLGIRGFIPASHVGNGKVRNLEKYIGEALPLKVIEVDKERRKVVLSHRLATEGEREKQREETMEMLREGQVRSGVVRRITDYGAFVDLGGVDGLLHISEMSWSRIKHPNEVVKQGQEIQVMVLKVSLEQGRISLGMRQILPDPWTEASKKYHAGDIIEGKISRLVQSGAFMALDGGIEGFIKNSELAQRRVARPEDVVKVGDTVQVKVLDVRPDERRIELSRKSQEKREERETGDRQMREYRQKQPEERFTLGDSQGDALAAYKAELEAAEAEAALSAPEVVEATPEPVEAAPEAVEVVEETAESAPEAVEAAPEAVEVVEETAESAPETVEAAPEAVEVVEETAESAPETVEVVEEAVEVVEETAEAAPETVEAVEEKPAE